MIYKGFLIKARQLTDDIEVDDKGIADISSGDVGEFEFYISSKDDEYGVHSISEYSIGAMRASIDKLINLGIKP